MDSITKSWAKHLVNEARGLYYLEGDECIPIDEKDAENSFEAWLNYYYEERLSAEEHGE